MTFKTYQLLDGAFATSSVNVPVTYTRVFDITPEQAYEIERGCGLVVENGELVILPLLEYEKYPDIPTDGDF